MRGRGRDGDRVRVRVTLRKGSRAVKPPVHHSIDSTGPGVEVGVGVGVG